MNSPNNSNNSNNHLDLPCQDSNSVTASHLDDNDGISGAAVVSAMSLEHHQPPPLDSTAAKTPQTTTLSQHAKKEVLADVASVVIRTLFASCTLLEDVVDDMCLRYSDFRELAKAEFQRQKSFIKNRLKIEQLNPTDRSVSHKFCEIADQVGQRSSEYEQGLEKLLTLSNTAATRCATKIHIKQGFTELAQKTEELDELLNDYDDNNIGYRGASPLVVTSSRKRPRSVLQPASASHQANRFHSSKSSSSSATPSISSFRRRSEREFLRPSYAQSIAKLKMTPVLATAASLFRNEIFAENRRSSLRFRRIPSLLSARRASTMTLSSEADVISNLDEENEGEESIGKKRQEDEDHEENDDLMISLDDNDSHTEQFRNEHHLEDGKHQLIDDTSRMMDDDDDDEEEDDDDEEDDNHDDNDEDEDEEEEDDEEQHKKEEAEEAASIIASPNPKIGKSYSNSGRPSEWDEGDDEDEDDDMVSRSSLVSGRDSIASDDAVCAQEIPSSTTESFTSFAGQGMPLAIDCTPPAPVRPKSPLTEQVMASRPPHPPGTNSQKCISKSACVNAPSAASSAFSLFKSPLMRIQEKLGIGSFSRPNNGDHDNANVTHAGAKESSSPLVLNTSSYPETTANDPVESNGCVSSENVPPTSSDNILPTNHPITGVHRFKKSLPPKQLADFNGRDELDVYATQGMQVVPSWASRGVWFKLAESQMNWNPYSLFGCGVRMVTFDAVFRTPDFRRAAHLAASVLRSGNKNWNTARLMAPMSREGRMKRWDSDKLTCGFSDSEFMSSDQLSKMVRSLNKPKDIGDMAFEDVWYPCTVECRHDMGREQPWYKCSNN